MKKIIGFIICTLLITATGFSVVGTGENRDGFNKNYTTSNLEHSPPLTGLFEWPMFRYELNNTGYSPSMAPDDDTVLWSKEFTYEIKSNPTIKDEKLYIVDNTQEPLTRGGDAYCLNAFTGEEIWKADQWDDEVWGSPTVANDKVYVLGMYRNLYCYDAYTGDELWTFEAYGHCSPMVFGDKVYFGSYGGGFYCLNATTGDKIWEFDNSTTISGCTPAIVNGKIYIGNDKGILYCLNADTGAEIWNSPDKTDWSSPAFYEDKIYVGYDKLYCLDADTGEDVWSVDLGVPRTWCSPAVAYGNVYIDGGWNFSEGDGKIYCYDANNGDWIWTSPLLGSYIWNGFAVADGKLYTCSNNFGNPAKFNCLDAYTGDIIWQFEFIVKGHVSSPAVAYGNVYVGSGDDKILYAFGTPNERPNKPLKPDGPDEGMVGLEYTFSTSTTDPEGDDIYYLFDWGDGNDSGWLGPYASGATVNASHIWTVEGDYWISVKAHDGRRESNWSEFHTISIIGSEPDLECDGSLSWIDIKPGETVEGNFTLLNNGEPYSLLNWEIESYPEWGIWGFNPQEGTGLTPEDDPIAVIVNVTAPDEKNSEFEGEIKIVNKENSSDYCTIDVSLATPKNKAFIFNFPLLNWLFERFPYVFPILRYILAL